MRYGVCPDAIRSAICCWTLDGERAITFEQSALVLAQVGKALVEANLIDDNRLELIVWAVRTRYARHLWDTPGMDAECLDPKIIRRFSTDLKVVDFRIPQPPQRRGQLNGTGGQGSGFTRLGTPDGRPPGILATA